MGTALRRAVFAVATVAVAVACRQLVGIGDAPPMGAAVDATAADSGAPEAGSDGPACGIAYAPEACGSCLVSSCCPQATACAESAACSKLEGCLGACAGDTACRATCVSANRFGPDVFETQLASCLAKSCAQPCGISCGGFAGGRLVLRREREPGPPAGLRKGYALSHTVTFLSMPVNQ